MTSRHANEPYDDANKHKYKIHSNKYFMVQLLIFTNIHIILIYPQFPVMEFFYLTFGMAEATGTHAPRYVMKIFQTLLFRVCFLWKNR